jgi:predicted metal-dependent peptidase
MRREESEEFKIFKDALLRSIPNPIYLEKELKTALKKTQFDLIAVDISGSMEKVLDEERVLRILQIIVNTSPTAKLLAIDTDVKRGWPKAKIGLQELLDLPRNGGTILQEAVSGCDLEHAVILTDDDGWKQLSGLDVPPYLVIEVGKETELEKDLSIPEIWLGKETIVKIKMFIGSEKTLYFHFRE